MSGTDNRVGHRIGLTVTLPLGFSLICLCPDPEVNP